MKIRIDASDIHKLAAQMRDGGAAMKRTVRGDVKTVSMEVMREVKIEMPVDTGRARASWGSPEAEGIWEESADGLTITQGTNVHYVEYLNEGHSQQAPAGFIDAIAEWGSGRLVDRVESDLEALLT